MNYELLIAKWNQLKGESKIQWGRLTSNNRLQLEGDHDKFIGKLQEFNVDQAEADRRRSNRQRSGTS